MAQKRPSIVDQQPSSSSSSSDEDHEQASSSEEEQDEEEENREPAPAPAPAPTKKPTSKNPPPPHAKPQAPPPPSDSLTDSGSESESESDNPPSSSPNLKTKPLATKPFEDSPKPKKPRPQPQATATPARSASKRAGENNQHVSESKKAKKKASDDTATTAAAESDEIPTAEDGGKKLGNDSKKLFQRIWSEEDEIAILKGLAEFSTKTGLDPYKDANAFHDFIKKSLRSEFSSNQLKEKIRRLKKKFENNAGKGKNGEGPKFSKPHEQRAFELSKKVWANGGEEPVKSDAKTKKNPKETSSSKNLSSVKPKVELVQQNLKEKENENENENSKENEQRGVDENADDLTVNLTGTIRFDNILGVSGMNEDVLKRGLQLIEASKMAELEERWKSLQVAELELYVKRAELIKDQARLIWEAYKSSNSNH